MVLSERRARFGPCVPNLIFMKHDWCIWNTISDIDTRVLKSFIVLSLGGGRVELRVSWLPSWFIILSSVSPIRWKDYALSCGFIG